MDPDHHQGLTDLLACLGHILLGIIAFYGLLSLLVGLSVVAEVIMSWIRP